MTKLKDSTEGDMYRFAEFSECEKYRFLLGRIWGKGKMVGFIGLNPSTADHRVDDPTIRRLIGFSKAWGYKGFIIINLFSYITPNPTFLTTVRDPLGEKGGVRDLDWYMNTEHEVDKIVFMWGNRGTLLSRNLKIEKRFPVAYCFGVSNNGQPKHPLYLPNGTTLKPYK